MTKMQLRTLATSSTAVTFVIIAVTGIMMYFHLFSSQVKELHEILGLVFVAATAAHLFVNWASMKGYFGKRNFVLLVAAGAAVSLLFVLEASTKQGGDPKAAVMNALLNAPLETSAPLLGVETETARERLRAAGYAVGKSGESIQSLARGKGVSPFAVVKELGAP